MRVFDPLLPEPPVNNVSDQQLLLIGMFDAETHPADDADGDRVLVLSLFGADIALHDPTSDGAPKRILPFSKNAPAGGRPSSHIRRDYDL